MRNYRKGYADKHQEGPLIVDIYQVAIWGRLGYEMKFKVRVRVVNEMGNNSGYWRWAKQFLEDYGFAGPNPATFKYKEDATRRFEGIKFALIGHFAMQEDKSRYEHR